MKCAVCGKDGDSSGEKVLVMYAGSAWKEGMATIEEGAELYYYKLFCIEHRPPEGTTDDA